MAPEQSRDFHGVDQRADIYSFGCILHDFVSDTPRVPHAQVACEGALARIIAKCTAVDPAQRYDSIASLRPELFETAPMAQVIDRSPQVGDWIRTLEVIDSMSPTKLRELIRFVETSEPEERKALLDCITVQMLQRLHAVDSVAWARFANRYCRYAHGSFPFAFCDSVVARLRVIYDLGKISQKSSAFVAAAELGAYHNRWYVMQRVVEMGSPAIPPQLAVRIVTDLQSEDGPSLHNLRKCVQQIGLNKHAYHPMIAAVL